MIAFMDIPDRVLEDFTNRTFNTTGARVIDRDYKALAILITSDNRETDFLYLVPDPNHRLIVTRYITDEQRNAYIELLKKLEVNPILDYERNNLLY